MPGIASCQKKFGPKYPNGFFAELGSMAYANMRPTASGSLFLVLVGPEKGLGVHFFSLLRLFVSSFLIVVGVILMHFYFTCVILCLQKFVTQGTNVQSHKIFYQ